MPAPVKIAITIANAAIASGAVGIGHYSFFVLEMPAALTGTAVAIHHLMDDDTYAAMTDDTGTVIPSITFTASKPVPIVTDAVVKALMSATSIKLVSTASEGAARSFFLWAK